MSPRTAQSMFDYDGNLEAAWFGRLSDSSAEPLDREEGSTPRPIATVYAEALDLPAAPVPGAKPARKRPW